MHIVLICVLRVNFGSFFVNYGQIPVAIRFKLQLNQLRQFDLTGGWFSLSDCDPVVVQIWMFVVIQFENVTNAKSQCRAGQNPKQLMLCYLIRSIMLNELLIGALNRKRWALAYAALSTFPLHSQPAFVLRTRDVLTVMTGMLLTVSN